MAPKKKAPSQADADTDSGAEESGKGKKEKKDPRAAGGGGNDGQYTQYTSPANAPSQPSSSAALSATSLVRKPQPSNHPRPNCDYCNWKGHPSHLCHQKLMDDQRKEIKSLKRSLKSPSGKKSVRAAQVSESDSD